MKIFFAIFTVIFFAVLAVAELPYYCPKKVIVIYDCNNEIAPCDEVRKDTVDVLFLRRDGGATVRKGDITNYYKNVELIGFVKCEE